MVGLKHLALGMIIVPALLLGACSRGIQRIDYSVEKLTNTLKDRDPNMRYWAATSLGSYGPEAYVAIPSLIQALQDDNAMVRMGAAYALAEMGQPAEQARSALTELTKDNDKETRDAAQYALKKISAKAASNNTKR